MISLFLSQQYARLTEDYCVPLIEKESDISLPKNFTAGIAQRESTLGPLKEKINQITKITSGSNKEIADFIDSFYGTIIDAGTFKAQTIKVAEAAKVIENIQRDVNIALINELAMIFDKMNINTNEVLKAASSKWNFMNFKPGLVGGHCIGVDPYYLAFKAKEYGVDPKMILAGRLINENMSDYVSSYIVSALKKL